MSSTATARVVARSQRVIGPAAACICVLLALPATASARDRLLAQGSWSWFSDPRALHVGSVGYTGWVDPRGRVQVGSYDLRSSRSVSVALYEFVDDHDNPSLSVRPDGRLTVFFSHHADDHIHYRVSRRPFDITAWGRELKVPTRHVGKLGNTYSNPIRLPAEGNRLWVFWRGSDWSTYFSTQIPGVGWSRPQRMIRVPHERPYVKYASDGAGTIHIAFSRAHPREGGTGIYYAKYTHGGFFRASGRPIRSIRQLPFRPREADKVYNARRWRADGWVHDIAVGRDGRPVIVYAVIHSRRRHSYRYARWNGARWENHFVTKAGGTISNTPREWAYSGGISLDKRDPSLVYLSRKVRRVNHIERWRTADRGSTWRHSRLTGHLNFGAYRPVVPDGLSAGYPGEVLWLQGYYGGYRRFRTWVNLRAGLPAPPAVVTVSNARPRRAGSREVRLRVNVVDVGPAPPLSWRWRFGDGQSAYGPTATHRYAAPGNYFATLRVRDAAGRENVYVREVRIPN